MIRDPQNLEEVFKPIWERVRQATDTIQRLRGEKASLTERLHEMERISREKLQVVESDLKSIRTELTVREQEIKRLKSENAQLSSADGQQSFSASEREILKERVRELIAKINSYL
jgi:FtsZ-binding cell division protein ZapB